MTVRATRETLRADLRRLGVSAGDILLVHASLRRIGPVDGGAAAVLAAIGDAVGQEGTVVVPAQTASNSDTSREHLAAIAGMSDDQVRRYRAAMPPFDPATTPSTGMGRIAELVRTAAAAVRSDHPQTSFAAVGPMAAKLMAGHALQCHLGEESPLARLYEADAKILLLGVGYQACTAFHLAEYRYLEHPPRRAYRCVVVRDGERRWLEYRDVALDDSDFAALGAALDETGVVSAGPVGAARCRLVSFAGAVGFAVGWLRSNRTSRQSRPSPY